MKITKRTLTKWRKEALKVVNSKPIEGIIDLGKKPLTDILNHNEKVILVDRILLMTQELLDQYLIKEK